MGDKPSVEAKHFQSDIDDQNLFYFVPVNPQDVQTTADVADTSLTNCASSSFNDTSGLVTSPQADVVVNGLTHSCDVSPSLSGQLAFSPNWRMKQSKSANYGMNGDRKAVSCQDGQRRLSMEAYMTSADVHPDDNNAVDSYDVASSDSSHNEAVNVNNSVLVEPPSPSASSTVTVLSVVHADNEGRYQKSGH